MPSVGGIPFSRPGSTAGTIMIVDDDEDIANTLLAIIRQETPHQTIYHAYGTQALTAVTRLKPHLFILDYNLPDMTGLELHDQLHAIEHVKEVPTLMISAYNPPRSEIQQRKITYLQQPFDLDTLLATIDRLLATV